jgi:hypothetical protein
MPRDWIQRRIAGNGRYLPLVARDADHIPEHVPPEKHRYCGYTPHEYRHFANLDCRFDDLIEGFGVLG